MQYSYNKDTQLREQPKLIANSTFDPIINRYQLTVRFWDQSSLSMFSLNVLIVEEIARKLLKALSLPVSLCAADFCQTSLSRARLAGLKCIRLPS